MDADGCICSTLLATTAVVIASMSSSILSR